MSHSMSLQYMEQHDDQPAAGYEFTDGGFELKPGMHLPRVGEFMQILTMTGCKDYVVLAVNTRMVLLDGREPGWHTVLTLGPGSEATDQRLLIIRE